MTNKEILNYIELIESELTDATNTGVETPENSDSLYYIDTAQELLIELRENLEGKFENDMDIFSENAFAGDGEGRLKGNN
jgi:hypothetical protein